MAVSTCASEVRASGRKLARNLRDVNGDKYCNMLVQNNNFHNNTCAIVLHNVHKDVFTKYFKHPGDNNFKGEFTQFLYSVGVQLVEPTNRTDETGTFICVVHNRDRENIQSILKGLFDNHSHCIWDSSYHNRCSQLFNQYPLVGYNQHRPCQRQATHNAVLACFEHYTNVYQIENEPPAELLTSLKCCRINDKLIVTCLPAKFPGAPNPSTKVSPAVTFANAASIEPPAPDTHSNVTDNNSTASNDK